MDTHALVMATAPLAFDITPLSTVVGGLSVSRPRSDPLSPVRGIGGLQWTNCTSRQKTYDSWPKYVGLHEEPWEQVAIY